MDLQGKSANGEALTEGSPEITSNSCNSTGVINQGGKRRDLAEHLEAYLARREGIDKLLKIARYSTQLILASSVAPKDAFLTKSLKDFEDSIGVSREALRLGKFIRGFNAVRKSSLKSREGILEILASGGECICYFVEQFVWLVDAGLIDRRYAARLQKISAWAEFVGYFGSVVLTSMQVSALLEEEAALKSRRANLGRGEDAAEINGLREKRFTEIASIIQDLAEGFMALSEICDEKGALSNPFLLASAGLLAALLSAHRNWSAC